MILMEKVICCIQAFDCEKTVEAAMQSVLDQTYDNWLCYILSNGNQNTPTAPNYSFDIIKSFAAHDKRFIVVNKKINDLQMYFRMLCHLANCFPHSYLCTLDADDEYERDFFARGLSMAAENNLNIVACGTEIICKKKAGDKEGTLISRRQIEKDLIVKDDQFANLFPVYKPFFNEMWGKLFQAELLRHNNYEQYIRESLSGRFLADTLITIDCLKKSRAIGVLSGTCHKFYQYEQRTSTNATLLVNAGLAYQEGRRLRQNRFTVYYTYQRIMAFLQTYGKIHAGVYEYMQAVLFGWFNDYYVRTLLPSQDEAVFSRLTAELVFHPKFDELMTYRDSGRYDNLRSYEQRLAFCRFLRHAVVGQMMVKNRKILWKENFTCSHATQRKLEKIAAKLEETIQTLTKLEKEVHNDAETVFAGCCSKA